MPKKDTSNRKKIQITETGDLGKYIKLARKERDLNQEELADAAQTGTRFISDLENGKETCQIQKVLDVVEELGLRLNLDLENMLTGADTTEHDHNKISNSIRPLYRLIGEIIGRQIFDRIANDENLSSSTKKRRDLARETIDTIMALRSELSGKRDFTKIVKSLEKVSIKQLAWILEAYLLLNQSSTTSTEVTSKNALISERAWAKELLTKLKQNFNGDHKKITELLANGFSANLVLTAHPTAGIQPDYIKHINNMVATVQKLVIKINESSELKDFINEDNDFINEIKEELELSISHMVRAKPYNRSNLKPRNESLNFLNNIEKAWDLIPKILYSLEAELKEILADKHARDFELNANFFKIHSWVARDIDGNPTVSQEEHIVSLLQERKYFLQKYFNDLQRLWQSLSDDFTCDSALPTKTFFRDVEFKNLYDLILKNYKSDIEKSDIPSYQAYRIVLSYACLKPLKEELDSLKQESKFTGFSLEENLLKPLYAIKRNKESANTKEIDLLIKKAHIFGLQGCIGHTRQGNEVLNKLYELSDSFSDFKNLKTEIKSLKLNDKKLKTKLLQSSELLEAAQLGAINRQIISMNQGYADMHNVLKLLKNIKRPLEIVPLTERIIDLRNSYECTVDALICDEWVEYLAHNQGHFTKMRGPSDSGKQNGFIASQWEMFKSKQLDTIVVGIFNDFLFSRDIKKWQSCKNSQNIEAQAISIALEKFQKKFSSNKKSSYLEKLKALGGVKLVNFDGWGEPVERGGGLEFYETVINTQPEGSNAYYERTLQGGGAQQFGSEPRTKQAIQDFIAGLLGTATHSEISFLDPGFAKTLDEIVLILRKSLREDVFGIDLEDDLKVSCLKTLRLYFRHVIKSPLIYLDLFNIASRPTSRSGTKIKELLEDPVYAFSLDKLAENLSSEEILSTLNDVRAIPYAAMFSLLGGNHVSFYGFDKALAQPKLIEKIKYYYHDYKPSQEQRLIRHMIDSLERGVITADMSCYKEAHTIIERANNSSYDPHKDELVSKLTHAQQSTINFIAEIKQYQAADKAKVQIHELMPGDTAYRDLLIARRNDAAVPRLGLAVSIAEILKHNASKKRNPIALENIPDNLLDLLRKAFAAGASTFGNGCID